MGYRRWSLKARLGILAGFLALFWGGTALLWMSKDKLSKNDAFDSVFGLFILIGILAILVTTLRSIFRQSRIDSHAIRRAKKFDTLLNPNQTKKPWWQFWQSRTNSQ